MRPEAIQLLHSLTIVTDCLLCLWVERVKAHELLLIIKVLKFG
jgi:hypothetical protein